LRGLSSRALHAVDMDMLRRFAILALLAAPLSAHALINRCADRTGTMIYSDKPCKAHHAVEAGPPIKTPEDAPGAKPASANPVLDQRSLRAVAVDASRLGNTGLGCPAYSRSALAEATRRAFESRDANQLSGITDWKGTSRGEADRLLARYAYLVKHSVASVNVGTVAASTLQPVAQAQLPQPAADDGVLTDVAAPPPIETIVVELGNGVDPGMTQYFRVASNGRCYWLKP
jgi:hypothetical protein